MVLANVISCQLCSLRKCMSTTAALQRLAPHASIVILQRPLLSVLCKKPHGRSAATGSLNSDLFCKGAVAVHVLFDRMLAMTAQTGQHMTMATLHRNV